MITTRELIEQARVTGETFAPLGESWPKNRRWVTKVCRHCEKEFTTDKPWQVNCSWKCSRDRMEALQRARRAQKKGRVIGEAQCVVCRAYNASMAFYKNERRLKGICWACAEDIEKMETPGRAFRLGYAITAVKNYVRA